MAVIPFVPMKPLIALSLSGIVATVASRPALAEVGVAEPVWTQVSALAVLASLLWYGMTRLIPQLGTDNKDAAAKLAAEHKEATALVVAAIAENGEKIEGVRAEIRAGNDSTLAMHRQFTDKIVALLDEKKPQ